MWLGIIGMCMLLFAFILPLAVIFVTALLMVFAGAVALQIVGLLTEATTGKHVCGKHSETAGSVAQTRSDVTEVPLKQG